MTLTDQHARTHALDPTQSFIVQAPAGSGKTELLVCRFLVLLANVERFPEEIVAITFTRKAASEMQQRIVDILKLANGAAPQEPHKYKTWELAKAVFERDQKEKWNLIQNPHRLRIHTIDALCLNLTRQMPLLSGLGASPRLLEDASDYYLEAVRQIMNHLEENSQLSQPLSDLFLHLDNNIERIENLLIRLLAKRDQWLSHTMSKGKYINSQSFRKVLEKSLVNINEEILKTCDQQFPITLRDEACLLFQFSACHLRKINPNSNIAQCSEMFEFPTADIKNRDAWIAIASLLLTKEHTWRLCIDKRSGFPVEDRTMKNRMIDLLKQLYPCEELRQSLQDLLESPLLKYSDAQWKILEALTLLLPVLVAQLHILFREKGVADFTEISMSALHALGDASSPTDLALILDYQIKHLLVDEFQDTSITQFHLLERLTAGWQAFDGRTLFLVGDPMQSIYRFREAEVGLFLKAQREGLGSISLVPLTLKTNFRSTPKLVNWINNNFRPLFPKNTDISFGAVPFNNSVSAITDNEESDVTIHPFLEKNENQLSEKIIQLIKKSQKKDIHENIAILVRSRSHLAQIIPALKKENLVFSAVEIQPLMKEVVVKDLLSLTGALLHVGDKLSWFSVLRAPWCGLTLHDLYAIENESTALFYDKLLKFEENSLLSDDGKERLSRVVPILIHSLQQRGRFLIREWVEKTWLALHGPRCLSNSTELESVHAYFELLENLEESDEIISLETLEKKINKKYATPQITQDCHLHLMTIHKSKGLEFDSVIIPHLESKNKNDDASLLMWLDRPRAGQENDLILAPITAKYEDDNSIYRHVCKIESKKSEYESTRLLYVAATRAKKSLHLMTFLNTDLSKKPVPNSFLSLLWSPISQCIETQHPSFTAMNEPSEIETVPTSPTILLQRLSINSMPEINSSLKLLTSAQQTSKFILGSFTEFQMSESTRHVGSLVHSILQRISQEGPQTWTLKKISLQHGHWKKVLREKGISLPQCSEILIKIEHAITRTLNDTRGQWILDSHTDHKSEYALTAIIDDVPQRFIVDRTFVDKNQIRWIIDYKTSELGDENSEIFLENAYKLHSQQLAQYARIMSQLDNRPIRLGLYFPLWGGWREWACLKVGV